MTGLIWFLTIGGILTAALVAVWWLARQSRRALLSWYGQASDQAVARFQAKLEPFKFARRTEVHERLMADPVVRAAIDDHARLHGASIDDTERQVSGYVREIVPFFNVLSYYRFGYAISRVFISILYQVRIATRDTGAAAEIPENDVVVYLMNHRSNADYVVVAFVLSGTVSISYAVGEWARTWPLEYLFKSFGSYFIRRRYRVPLYHTVLARYIQLITRNRVTQGIFPEGGLTRDGALRPPKLGLLDYLAGTLADEAFDGDIWLVPVGINYDRVLEDRTLIQERIVGSRRRGKIRQFGSVVHYLTRNIARLALGRFQRYGEVAVAFGDPLSVRTWLARQPEAVLDLPKDARLPHIQRLAAEALAKVGDVVPVTPVPLAAAALLSLHGSAVTRPQVLERMDELRDALKERGAMLANPHASVEELWQRAWRILRMRRLVVEEGGILVVMPRQRPLLEYYANSLAHLLPETARPTMTPAAEPDPTLPRLARRDEMSVETGSYTLGDNPPDGKGGPAPPRSS